MGKIAIAALCLTTLTSSLCSQTLLWERFGEPDVTSIGPTLSGTTFLGDVDGDGFNDLLQDIRHLLRPTSEQRELTILSGRTGDILGILNPIGQAIQRPQRLGDMDGDGIADYKHNEGGSDGRSNIVKVFSSRTQCLLWEVSGLIREDFGRHVNGESDVNGDGTPDLLVTARRADPQPGGFDLGAVYGYDGKDGRFLFRMNGVFPAFGFSIAHVGDIDGDGCDEFVVGGFEPVGRGGAFVHSGKTQELLGFGTGEFLGDNLGLLATECGDMTGDGIPEFAAGSDGSFKPSLVRVFDGHSMKPIYTWRRPVNSGFGMQLRGDGNDFDLDGVPDLLVSSFEQGSTGAAGTIYAFSGRDGELLFKVFGTRAPTDPTGRFGFGCRVVMVPPQPGDPFPRFAASQGWDIRFFRGRVATFATRPEGVDLLGYGCLGNDGPKMGMRRVDFGEATETTRVHLSGAPPDAAAFLVVGLSSAHASGLSLPLDLEAFGLANCLLRVSTDLIIPRRTGRVGNDLGYAAVDISLPLAADGPGQIEVHGQWVVFDTRNEPARPISLSNALSWRH